MSQLVSQVVNYAQQSTTSTILTIAVGLVLAVALSRVIASVLGTSNGTRHPPMVPYVVPFIGSMISFGMNPLKFLEENRLKYGDCYTFLMFGRKMTYLMGAEGNNFVLNTCKLKEVSAEEAYKHLTVPVFGEGVIYDVPNSVMMEQKRFVKHGLSPENLRLYVPMIEKETREYFARWKGDTGRAELSEAIAELTILTASRCLMGSFIREQLSETVAQLYCDLDKGFTPLNFLFKWLPLESYRKRDEAHIKMRELFLRIMKDRRERGEMDNSDMMQSLMDCEYRDGRKMNDKEVACLMIALLMAGQHTSSTTATWCLSYLAQDKELRQRLLQEQKEVLGDDLSAPLDYEALKSMELLDRCVKETLRLKPPIITVLRKVMSDVQYKDYTIPEGHYVCVAPSLAQLDSSLWGKDVSKFTPDRFNECQNPGLSKCLGHGASSSYLPFGAGRHRCIGEAFAYVQLKTIIATFIRMFDFEFPAGGKGFPDTDFTTLIVMPVKPVAIDYQRRTSLGVNGTTADLQTEE
ncbi:hypothetical protein MIR68_010033 [Amoeboaphelidium protococcarum]|nr:hypothetical protein MIR68_010033 [Amoeboaphelidium protococcarum]